MTSSSCTTAKPVRVPTILITGASGMLGRALHRLLLLNSREKYKVVGTGLSRLTVPHYHQYYSTPSASSSSPSAIDVPENTTLHRLDLLDYSSTSSFVRQLLPDVIVHCAAERFPDAFESNFERSHKLNVDSTRHLAEECLRLAGQTGTAGGNKPHLIYLSTSYVFDGGVTSGAFPPYDPKDAAAPLNGYGKSKWEGECAVRETLPDQGIIVRVPLLYGEDCTDLGESPALDMMKVFLPRHEQINAKKIDDWALRFPTSVEDVAKVLSLIIDKLVSSTSSSNDNKQSSFPPGTYHVASPHGTTKYALMQLQSQIFNFTSEYVSERAIPNKDGPPPGSAPRPQCTQLNCEETWRALGMDEKSTFRFITLKEGMERALNGFPQRFIKSDDS